MTNEIREIIVEVEINAPTEQVWVKMLEEIELWWPRDFVGLEDSGGIQLEKFAGGRLYESSPQGGHLLWGTVLMIVPGKSVEFAGHISPTFGGPSLSFSKMAIEPNDNGGTKFRLTNSVVGHTSGEGGDNVRQGWEYLSSTLKEYCEK